MTAPSVVDAGKSEGSAPSTLDAELNELFGDGPSGSSESPEPATPDAGTTPAEGAPGAEKPEGEPATPADGDASKAGESAETTSDTPPATDASEADPFAGSETLQFTVNGKPMQFEGIAVFKDGGAVVRPEAIPLLQQRLSERESLQGRLHAQSHEYQTLAKATEWTDANNKTWTGPEAAIEMRIGNAGLFAENALLIEHLNDPDKLFALLATEQVPDGKGGMVDRVVLNPKAVEDLRREATLQRREIDAKIRDHYKDVLSKVQAPAPAVDYATEAPKLIQAIATASQLDASVLSLLDVQLLTKQLPRHIEKGQNGALASLDWQELVKDRITLRTEQKANAGKIASTASQATKDAQARMAAAARGVKPKPGIPAKPKPAVPAHVAQAQERADNEGQLFDAMLSAGAAAMRTTG